MPRYLIDLDQGSSVLVAVAVIATDIEMSPIRIQQYDFLAFTSLIR